MYRNGYGVPQDYQKAIEFYTLAVNQNNSFAHYNLGTHPFLFLRL